MSFIQLQFDWKITKMTEWHSSAIQLPFQTFPLTFIVDWTTKLHPSISQITIYFYAGTAPYPYMYLYFVLYVNVVEHIDLYQLHVNLCTARNGQIFDVVYYSPLTKHHWKKAQSSRDIQNRIYVANCSKFAKKAHSAYRFSVGFFSDFMRRVIHKKVC